MLKKNLCVLAILSLSACGVELPSFPEVNQCAWSVSSQRFLCVNSVTNQRSVRSSTDPTMNGAQVLSIDDYKKSEAWVDQVKEIAKQRCN